MGAAPATAEASSIRLRRHDADGTTVSNSSACSGGREDSDCNGSGGGIISSAGPLVLTNSTIAQQLWVRRLGTACEGTAGAILAGRQTHAYHSTISDNSPANSKQIPVRARSAASKQRKDLSVQHHPGRQPRHAGKPDCSGAISDGKPNGTNTVGHNIIGTPPDVRSIPGGSDQLNVVIPGLAVLAANGGPDSDHAPLPGSPAIANGDAGTCALTSIHDAGGGTDPGPAGKDQRGEPRPAEECDIGAYQTIPDVYVGPRATTIMTAPRKPSIGRRGPAPAGTSTMATSSLRRRYGACRHRNLLRPRPTSPVQSRSSGQEVGQSLMAAPAAGNPCALGAESRTLVVVIVTTGSESRRSRSGD